MPGWFDASRLWLRPRHGVARAILADPRTVHAGAAARDGGVKLKI